MPIVKKSVAKPGKPASKSSIGASIKSAVSSPTAKRIATAAGVAAVGIGAVAVARKAFGKVGQRKGRSSTAKLRSAITRAILKRKLIVEKRRLFREQMKVVV